MQDQLKSDDFQFGIIGLGLIGGSIAKSLSANKFEVFAEDPNKSYFDEAIKDKKARNVTSETTFIGINSAEIKEHSQNKNMLEVSVEFVSEIISCIKDKDNKIVSGDSQKVKKVLDTWKFTKDGTSKNPNWLIVDTQA